MYSYATLENTNVQTLYGVFRDAFSDYPVPVSLSFAEHQHMLKRRGYVGELSIGAFHEPGHALVGFLFNGLRYWQGMLTAYDTGTGVLAAHRRQGLTSRMLQTALQVLAAKQVRRYVLEVLQENGAALALYRKQGFSVTRGFSCWKQVKPARAPQASAWKLGYPTGFTPREWDGFPSFWDVLPSWQNSVDSVEAVRDDFVYVTVEKDHRIVGYGLAGKASGDVPQLAVHQGFRRRGIAAGLVAALQAATKAESLRFLNVDDACRDIRCFLSATGFEKYTSQYEMMLPLA